MATLTGFTAKRKSWEGVEERQSFQEETIKIDVIKDEKVVKTFSDKLENYSTLWKEVDKFESGLGVTRLVELTAPDGTKGSYTKFQEDYQHGETHGLSVC